MCDERGSLTGNVTMHTEVFVRDAVNGRSAGYIHAHFVPGGKAVCTACGHTETYPSPLSRRVSWQVALVACAMSVSVGALILMVLYAWDTARVRRRPYNILAPLPADSLTPCLRR